MARYSTALTTAFSVAHAFEQLADLTGFAQWDPGVIAATQLAPGTDTRPGVGARYQLTLKAPLGRPQIEYIVTGFEQSEERCKIAFEGAVNGLRSIDEIRVERMGGKTRVTYEARLEIAHDFYWFARGRSLADRLLGLYFRRLGDAAAVGLRRFLHGEKVAS